MCRKEVAGSRKTLLENDSKECGTSVRALPALPDKTGLIHYVFGEEKDEKRVILSFPRFFLP